jgi:acetyl-CoA C-acetyltransferase
VSGHVPQVVINRLCADVVAGRSRLALVAGGEVLHTEQRLAKRGTEHRWASPPGEPVLLFPRKRFATPHERTHGIWLARDAYPLFETALMARYGHSVAEHFGALGHLWARFSATASTNPFAWFRSPMSPAEIVSPSGSNRFVSWPYTKCMNAMNQVDQAAAVLITSVTNARRLGISPTRWLCLHGCAEAGEHGFVSERADYYGSPAIRLMTEVALDMADMTVDDIHLFDLYSCFPCAVEIARDELGLQANDPRPLTVTGGLAFNGGAGSSYVLNALAAMADRLRAAPGTVGMVTANGGLLSEHAVGIYSTSPSPNVARGVAWQQDESSDLQVRIDRLPAPKLNEKPAGVGAIEAYTVVYGRDGRPARGIVIGRLGDGSGHRFLANTVPDYSLLEAMCQTCFVGATGRVTATEDFNLFQLR